MATARHVPVEVYLHSSYAPDAEYVDGTIERRPAAQYDHSSWQGAILHWFYGIGDGKNFYALPSLRIKVSATRIRVPDVTLLDRNQPKEQMLTHAPLAVFEVLSTEDTVQRLLRKLEDYLLMGIPEIWVIDPQDSSYYRYKDRQLLPKQVFSHPKGAITFEMNEIKKLID